MQFDEVTLCLPNANSPNVCLSSNSFPVNEAGIWKWIWWFDFGSRNGGAIELKLLDKDEGLFLRLEKHNDAFHSACEMPSSKVVGWRLARKWYVYTASTERTVQKHNVPTCFCFIFTNPGSDEMAYQ